MTKKLEEKIELEPISVTEEEFDTSFYKTIGQYQNHIRKYQAKINKLLKIWSKIEFYKATNHYITYHFNPNNNTYIYLMTPRQKAGFNVSTKSPIEE